MGFGGYVLSRFFILFVFSHCNLGIWISFVGCVSDMKFYPAFVDLKFGSAFIVDIVWLLYDQV